jgi:hypothetical protein
MKNITLLYIIGVIMLLIILFRKKINTTLKMTRGYRNNNPGNIRKTYDANGNQTFWTGEIIGIDPSFKTFKSMAYGYRALFALLKEYNRKGYNTITKVINRYAPSNENDTNSYINTVSLKTGLHPDTLIDLSNETLFKSLVSAISFQENGIIPDKKDINNGYKLT